MPKVSFSEEKNQYRLSVLFCMPVLILVSHFQSARARETERKRGVGVGERVRGRERAGTSNGDTRSPLTRVIRMIHLPSTRQTANLSEQLRCDINSCLVGEWLQQAVDVAPLLAPHVACV